MATQAKRSAEDRIAEERERIRRSREAIKRIRAEEAERVRKEALERHERYGRRIEEVSGGELDEALAELLGNLMWEVMQGGEEARLLRAEAERVSAARRDPGQDPIPASEGVSRDVKDFEDGSDAGIE